MSTSGEGASQPLYSANAIADASHEVRAPGGYEWWYFDAEDPATDTQLVVIYLNGFIFHPGYLRAYAKFVRRPTVAPPPLPSDFACAYFVLYHGGKIIAQSMTQYPASQYAASRDAVDVRIGPNSLTKDAGGLRLHVDSTPWVLTWQGPKLLAEQRLTADLTFAPALPHPPHERRFFSQQMTGADHHWVIANPLCNVTAQIQVGPAGGGGATADYTFTGQGYHDHNYGTAPIGQGLATWIWGRAIVGGRVVMFHYAVARGAAHAAESHLIIADGERITESDIAPAMTFDRRSVAGLAYPSRARWPNVMSLSNPRVIDSTPFYLRLQYDADVGGRRTVAFCEVAHPHRLRWPVLGRMIEMSIDKRAMTAAAAAR